MINDFIEMNDEELIDKYLELEDKICNMILLTEEEQENFEAMFQEIAGRNIHGKINERRNNENK